jgi:hypothetical protein
VKRLAIVVAFLAGAALPPAAVWLATRGPGPARPVLSAPTGQSDAEAPVARQRLDTWIDRAIARYLATHSASRRSRKRRSAGCTTRARAAR